MRRIAVVMATLCAASLTFGGGTPPSDRLTYKNGDLVLTSANPPTACNAKPVANDKPVTPADDKKSKETEKSNTRTTPKTSTTTKGKEKEATTPAANPASASGDGSGSSNARVGDASAQYHITLSTDCIKQLTTPEATLSGSDGYFSGQTALSDVKYLGANAKVVDVQDQAPYLIFDNNGDVYRVLALPAKSHSDDKNDTKVAPCTDAAYAGKGTADVELDLVGAPSIRKVPPRNIVAPNQGLVVLVCHDPTKPLIVTWGGTRGLTRAEIAGTGSATGSADAMTTNHETKSEIVPPTVVRLAFSPRRAGTADLQAYENTKATGDPVLQVELEVEPLYWGSVRFGLGTLFGAWNSYSVVTDAGSRTAEVRQDPQRMTFELVAGFAPYVIEDLAYGGRSQSGGHDWHIAPYIGFGIVGSNPTTGVQGLTSFHAGIEYEIADNLSIALTFVYRRTKTLASNYAVGSPVGASMTIDNITVDNGKAGFGVVINATPAFLQFATGGSTTSGGKP